MAKPFKKPNTGDMNRLRIYNTFRAQSNVTYQVMAYRELNGDELKKKVVGFLNKTKRPLWPHAGDVVIINTSIGLRRN
jgi:hypothetical protein